MSIDLRATLFPEPEPQPDAVTDDLHRLCASVLHSKNPSIWEQVIPAYTEQARAWVRSGVVNGTNAASVIFISHALSATHKASAHHGASLIFGFVMQLGLSEAAWVTCQEAIAAEFARLDRADHLQARQWLALGKSRFQIAPYIGLSSPQPVSR
jgi:hypothetical protein